MSVRFRSGLLNIQVAVHAKLLIYMPPGSYSCIQHGDLNPA